MRIFLLIALLTPMIAIAKSSVDTEIGEVMKTYLSSLKYKNRKKLKTVVTKKYYKQLDKDNDLNKLFKMQSNDKNEIVFDYKVIPNLKGHWANIKNKNEKDYGHYWFNIVKDKDGYKIDGTVNLDELNLKK